MLELIAGVILLANCALGIFVGRYIYKALNTTMYPWARITTAVILGLATFLFVGELTHSHKLIRYYEHYSSDYDVDN